MRQLESIGVDIIQFRNKRIKDETFTDGWSKRNNRIESQDILVL